MNSRFEARTPWPINFYDLFQYAFFRVWFHGDWISIYMASIKNIHTHNKPIIFHRIECIKFYWFNYKSCADREFHLILFFVRTSAKSVNVSKRDKQKCDLLFRIQRLTHCEYYWNLISIINPVKDSYRCNRYRHINREMLAPSRNVLRDTTSFSFECWTHTSIVCFFFFLFLIYFHFRVQFKCPLILWGFFLELKQIYGWKRWKLKNAFGQKWRYCWIPLFRGPFNILSTKWIYIWSTKWIYI